MNSSKNMLIALGGIVSSIALINNLQKKNIKENFGGLNYPFAHKVNREVKLNNNDMYSVSGNYQASLSPRFSNVDYGANIRYNLPSYDNMASPSNPIQYEYFENQNKTAMLSPEHLDYSNIASEATDIAYNRNADKLMYDWSSVPLSSSDLPNLSTSKSGCLQSREYVDVQDMLPVGDMCTYNNTMVIQSNNIKNEAEQSMRSGIQPVVYDRFMYANGKSRLRSQADPVRGDLPIVPVLPEANKSSQVWFRPSATPSIDLGRGYLAAAGGFDNTTNNQLRSLMNASLDGSLQTFGGNNISSQKELLKSGAGDIVINSFN